MVHDKDTTQFELTDEQWDAFIQRLAEPVVVKPRLGEKALLSDDPFIKEQVEL